jgi:DNA-binding CsgD family transcriptional regulator
VDGLRRLNDGVFACASTAVSLGCFRQSMARQVISFVGADVAVAHAILPPPVESAQANAAVNLDARYFDQFLRCRARYFDSALPLYRALIDHGRPIIDTDHLPRAAIERLPVYAEVIIPARVRTILAVPLSFRGVTTGMLALGRGGRGARFRARDAERVLEVLPLLGMADAAVGARCATGGAASLVSLGTRERQVARLIAAGLQNKEIAACLGTSADTVRKQTIRIYEKLGVPGRVSLVARFGEVLRREP